jgi:hypothetical protein
MAAPFQIATKKLKKSPAPLRPAGNGETPQNEEAGLSPGFLYENKALLKPLRDSCDAAVQRLNKHTRTCVLHSVNVLIVPESLSLSSHQYW